MRRDAAACAALLVVLALGAVGCRDDDAPASVPDEVTTMPATTAGTTEPAADGTTVTVGESPEAGAPYSLAATQRCLRAAGADVSAIRSPNPRLRALGDLAQRTSVQVQLDGDTLGLAFGDALLLGSLLRVPDDPYRLEVRRNALLMYESGTEDGAAVVRRCLRN